MLSSSFVFLKKFRVIKKAKFIVDYQPEIGLRVFLLLDFVRSLVFLKALKMAFMLISRYFRTVSIMF